MHYPTHCHLCGATLHLDLHTSVAHNGLYKLDIDRGREHGLHFTHIKHVYHDVTCTCGHVSRCAPQRSEDDPNWQVSLSEWHLCGPTLISFLVCLNKSHHISCQRIRLFCEDWFGISLSKGVINQCIREAGRAVEPLKDEMICNLMEGSILYADETIWKQAGEKKWLWVFLNYTVALFVVGSRSKAVAEVILSEFSGILMSDGYKGYRFFSERLRCWAHLIRKCKGLSDSRNKTAHEFGKQGKHLFTLLITSVNAARGDPTCSTNIQDKHARDLLVFKQLCLQHKNSEHEKLRALAREFLNDWDAIWRALQDITLPLTNNDAERQLRHWVINRLISHGTRSNEGSESFAMLASVIETCRLRNTCPWKYIAEVITARRKDNATPPLPPISCAA